MATLLHETIAIQQTNKWPRPNRALTYRFVLVPIAVSICYLFDWSFLRSLTADFNLRLTSLAGFHWIRLSSDMVMFEGHRYRYAIACTMADAWCAAIPLVWSVRSRVSQNLFYLAGLAGFMFVFNLVRLTVSNVLLSNGVIFFWSHQTVSAVTYLIVWLLIQRRSAWRDAEVGL